MRPPSTGVIAIWVNRRKFVARDKADYEFAMSRRAARSAESVHPLSGRELRALRRLKREQDPASPFIFTSNAARRSRRRAFAR